jgi:Glycosyl transferases group 1
MMRGLKSADPEKLSILEIGDHGLFKAIHPGNTVRLMTDPRQRPVPGLTPFGWRPWRRLVGEIRDGRFDMIVCYPRLYAPWDTRSFGDAFLAGLPRLVDPVYRTFGLLAACRTANVPLVAIDYDDSFAINRHNFRVLDRCQLYFKRELPMDNWRAFFKTGHRNLPTKRIRKSARYRARIGKLRPISLGLPQSVLRVAPAPAEKDQDVFFAGQIELNSTVREAGLRQIEALARRGYRVDFARERIPTDQYVARCARSWLTWSPEGLGWDCRRHYEAPYCGSVPIISRAAIQRHRPLLEGEHAFYYDVEDQHLTRTIETALADKDRLARMAAAGRAHVLAHHTVRAICAYVAAETYGASAG